MTTQEHQTRVPLSGRLTKESMNDVGTDLTRPARARTPDELVTFFSPIVWRFVSSQISRREDAEDVVMEVFAAAFGHFSRLEAADDQRLWLLAVARNKVASCLRKQYRRAERPYSDAGPSSGAAEVSDMQLATRNALERLPDNQRQALVLKYVNGLSTAEVGKVIRKSLQATNSLLQRSRESLRQTLGPALAEYSQEAT